MSSCEPNPDVAGHGVVVGNIIMAGFVVLSTTFILLSDKHFKVRWFSQHWSNIVQATLSGLSITQFIAGVTLTTMLFLMYPYHSGTKDPHALIGLVIAIMAVCSSETAMFTTGWSYYRRLDDRQDAAIGLAVFRIAAGGTALVLALMLVNGWYPSLPGEPVLKAAAITIWAIAIIFLLLNFGLLIATTEDSGRRRGRSSLVAKVTFGFGIGLGLLGTIVAGVIAILLKYTPWGSTCSLNQPEDNEWTLGQLLTLWMLLTVPYGLYEGFISKRRDSNSRYSLVDA